MKEIAVAAVKRVLVIRGGALGDFVLTLPILRCIGQVIPEAEIDVLGYPEIAQLAVEGGLAKRVHRVDAARFSPLFAETFRKDDALAAWFADFDLVVSVWRDPEARLVHRLRELGVKESFHIEPIPPEGAHTHAADYMLGQLPAKWRRKARADEPLALPPATRNWATEYVFRNLGLRASNLYAVHPGSGGRGKNRNWPADRFARVIKRVFASGDSACFIIRGPADDHAVRAVQSELRGVNVPIAAGLKPVELASLLSSVRAVVGNDSGVTHLAATLGVRTVVIFGATDSVVWAPRGPQVRVLQGRSKRGPSTRQGNCPGNIEDVTAAEVVAELGL